MITVKIKQ